MKLKRREWLPDEHPAVKGIALALLSAAIIALIEFTFALSVSVYLFPGNLSSYVGVGVGAVMLASVIPTLAAVFFGTNPATLCGARGAIMPLLATLIAGINASLLASGQSQTILPTLVASIGVATICSGILLAVFGIFKWGNLIRSIPYPVMGGFFAGLGYLFITGALAAMTGREVSLSLLPELFQLEALSKWLPGVAFGLALYLLQKTIKHWLVFPSALAAAMLLFYIILFSFGWNIDSARDAGWMISNIESGQFWPAITPDQFDQIHWAIVFTQSGAIFALFAINAISLLLDASGIELMTRREIDLNKELKSNGTSNILTGLLGGIAGVHSVGNTAFTYQLSGCNRLSALAYAGFSLLALTLGPVMIQIFPLPILGGLLCVVGFGFMDEWLLQAYKRLPRADYLLVLLIVLCIAVLGVLPGVAIGFLLAVLQFALSYSRLSSVKFVLSGKEIDTYVDRPESQLEVLEKTAGAIHGMILQGFLFFGSAHSLIEQVRRRLKEAELPKLEYLILDFRLVNKMDSSVAQSFSKLLLLAEQEGLEIVFTDISANHLALFRRIGVPIESSDCIHLFDEFSEGGRWCEDRLIEKYSSEPDEAVDPIALLKEVWGIEDVRGIAESYLSELSLEENEHLFRMGDPPDGLYLVASGRLQVLRDDALKERRLYLVGPGSILGEMALYNNSPRSATVRAVGSATVWHLTAENWEALRRDRPMQAERFHMIVIRLLSRRLDKSNLRLLRALS